MGRTPIRAAAALAIAALFTATGSAVAFAEDDSAPPPPPSDVSTPVGLEAGQYIVLLDEDPAATYAGGEQGLAPTKPGDGEKLDPTDPAVEQYSEFLEDRQNDVASEVGVQVDQSLTITLNAFTAGLSAEQATKLAGKEGVRAVVPDEIVHPVAVPSTEFLGLSGPGGVWESIGGAERAGEGIVVGVIDTGIAPENPSFAGDPLGTTPGAAPYLSGNTVVFNKADGTQFRSERVEGDQWSADFYSTKLIGAQYFSAGAAASGFDFQYDILSPRDGDGHGSHTASTAAGNADVTATVDGRDFGAIAGVAPGARIAAYKACYDGPDPNVTDDDICATSDLLAAINQAARDNVDVINYSISGTQNSVLGLEDEAFYNAAAAGIFVAVSAGNDGPAASTASHASPWYTTVAASTIPTYEGTVELGDGALLPGATTSVPFGGSVTGPVVYAGDIAASDAAVADAALCLPGTLDIAKATGHIVVCDRGVNARVEKSQTVADVGGIGAILVNVVDGSLDTDLHAVPTVHVQAEYRAALLAYVQGTPGATATLLPENITGIVTPTPIIAGFSSRGPMLADGSDILKPDLTAPGVNILAAENNPQGQPVTFGLKSGTSMSSPHVAGLAALYLGERPTASPAEIKSALMTTAYDTVDSAGDTVQDPFSQGAGHVDPRKFFEPGLLYLNGPRDWAAFLEGKGLRDFAGVDPIDGSDLNIASIAIGTLPYTQTVTRTVTATTAGTYTAAVDVPGIDAVVEPSSISLAVGESATFTVTFTKADAAVETWTTGFLTWTADGVNAVRSPIAIYPVTADAPKNVSGEGVAGSVDVSIVPGVTGDVPLHLSGLAPAVLQTDPNNPVPGHTGDEMSGDALKNVDMIVTVPDGATLARWDLDSSDDEGSDLDLIVRRVVSETDLRYYEQWASATGSADESVVLENPTAGTYLVRVNVYSFTQPFTWDLHATTVDANGVGSLTATPNPLAVTQGTPATYTLSWNGLEPETRYFGVVRYADSQVTTILQVDSGAALPPAPVLVTAPSVSGSAVVGGTLTATPGTWDPADVTTTIQWLRDGEPIEGATATSYRAVAADRGTGISVRVTATSPGAAASATADSNVVTIKSASSTKVSLKPYLGTTRTAFSATVSVTGADGVTPTGTITLWVNSKQYTAELVNGKVVIPLDRQTRGVKVVIGTYGGDDLHLPSLDVNAFLVLF